MLVHVHVLVLVLALRHRAIHDRARAEGTRIGSQFVRHRAMRKGELPPLALASLDECLLGLGGRRRRSKARPFVDEHEHEHVHEHVATYLISTLIVSVVLPSVMSK